MKNIVMLFLFILNVNVYAKNIEHDTYYEKGREYVLVKNEADTFLRDYTLYIKKLQTCEKHRFDYYNPLIHSKGFFEIFGLKKNNKCLIYINYNNIREIKCDLSQNDRQKLIEARGKLIRQKSGFGELSEIEKKVYYDKSKCKQKITTKLTQEEVDMSKLKDNIQNPELLEFLKLLKSKK